MYFDIVPVSHFSKLVLKLVKINYSYVHCLIHNTTNEPKLWLISLRMPIQNIDIK